MFYVIFKILKCLKYVLKTYITYVYVLRLRNVEGKKTFVLPSSLRIPDTYLLFENPKSLSPPKEPQTSYQPA